MAETAHRLFLHLGVDMWHGENGMRVLCVTPGARILEEGVPSPLSFPFHWLEAENKGTIGDGGTTR